MAPVTTVSNRSAAQLSVCNGGAQPGESANACSRRLLGSCWQTYPSLALINASCCSMTWENLPNFFLRCISLFGMSSSEASEKENISCCKSCCREWDVNYFLFCLHKLGSFWGLWKRLRVATPSAWRKSNSWGRRKWKKVEINTTIASGLPDHIVSHSSWLSFYVAE